MKSHYITLNYFHNSNILNLWNAVISSCKRLLLFCLISIWSINSISAQCGMDIFIANDQSGSVDAIENAQSRAFITSLASSLDLGENEDQIRIAIGDWDSQNNWVQYNFPNSGINFTSQLSDIIAYQNANRVLSGGTDLTMALRKTYEMIIQNPNKRSVPEMIILMTDIGCSNNAALLELSSQIMSEGIFIAVFAIDAAYNCPYLMDVATPGGHFDAYNYEDLMVYGNGYTNSLIGVACSNMKYVFDFNIKIDAFNADKCFPGPGVYTVDYTIQNRGMEDFKDQLFISFYDEDPSLPSAKLIGVQSTNIIDLPKGGVCHGVYSNDALKYYETVYAIVNFDGSLTNNKVPIYPQTLHPLLVFEGERTALNNFSNGVIRNNAAACIPTATVQVNIETEGIGCGDIAIYTANICNTGNADAIISNAIPISSEGFQLLYSEISLDSMNSTHWATYYGGNVHDYIYSSTIDKWGNIYLLGQSNSTVGVASLISYQPNNAGDNDAFLVKFSSKGKRLWATYFGGLGSEDGFSVTTDSDGNVIITGQTQNSQLPTTATSHQINNGGAIDAYLAKFNSSGNLLWATYYGGSGIDKGKTVYTDSKNNIYLLGDTESPDKISTGGAMQNSLNGISDAFLVKFDMNGQRIWGTYIGGTALETGFGMVVDKNDFIYITGLTGSTTGISTPGTGQVVKGFGNDAYLIKIDKNGNKVWGSYIGGNGNDSGTGLGMDSEGNLYVSGNSSSTTGMATTSTHQPTLGGGTDAFLSKFTSNGKKVWTTYYGGSATDNGRNVIVDLQDNIYLTGYSLSVNNISTSDGIQASIGGGADAFIAKFNTNGERIWGTYFGGPNNDYGLSVVVDALGKLYLSGATQSTADIATDKSYQPTFGGGPYDGYLLKIDESNSFILKASECVSFKYYYNTKKATSGNHDFSFLINAEKNQSSDGEPNILPDTNFDILGDSGVNGYLGSLHLEDNLIVTSTSFICPTGDLVKVNVKFVQNSTCKINDAPIIAEISIENLTGLTLRDLNLSFNLTSLDAYFESEPYQISNEFLIALVNKFQINYPNIPNALNHKKGVVSLPIYQLPIGKSEFKINIQPSEMNTQLDVSVDNIPTIYVSNGKSNIATVIQDNSSILSPEILNWSCPNTINTTQNIQINGIATQFVDKVFWHSSTKGALNNVGTIQQPTLNYSLQPLDLANGYADISLQVENNDGCTDMKFCRIQIENVALDYGDAPKSYDLNYSQQPVAASATISNEIYLGQIKPSSEKLVKHSNKAVGEGAEEDALLDQCFVQPKANTDYIIRIGVTNNSAKPAFLNAFIDWNQEGNWIDTLKKAKKILQIPAMSNYKEYELIWNVPAYAMINSNGVFLRLRLSSDSSYIIYPFGNSPEGEIEDHWIEFSSQKNVNLTKEICTGDSVKVGASIYKTTGIYRDTITSYSGCDSIVVLNLQVNSILEESLHVNICSGEKYIFGGKEVNSSGIYRDTTKSSSACDSIIILDLQVKDASVSKDTLEICKGDTIIWNGMEYSTMGDFQQILISEYGCDSLAMLNVYYSDTCDPNQDCYLIFPNVFTPNNDGINDVFRPIYICEIERYSLEIYNRWGKLIYHTTQPELGWNGTFDGEVQSQDNYIYQVVYSFEDDIHSNFVKGGLLLLR